MGTLSTEQRRLFEEPNVGHLATLNPDGSPQVSPVWVDVDDGLILVNTARGRIKDRNTARDPRVAISIHDRRDPLRRVSVQGRVVERTEEGAVEHIHALSRKYWGREYDRLTPGMVRLILKIQPDRISGKL